MAMVYLQPKETICVTWGAAPKLRLFHKSAAQTVKHKALLPGRPSMQQQEKSEGLEDDTLYQAI